MNYKKGDIVSISYTEGKSKSKLAVIIQADWFNLGEPPSYVISLLSSQVYPELDFRPVIIPDHKNSLTNEVQAIVDKLQPIKSSLILKKIGELNPKHIKSINGCVKSVLGL